LSFSVSPLATWESLLEVELFSPFLSLPAPSVADWPLSSEGHSGVNMVLLQMAFIVQVRFSIPGNSVLPPRIQLSKWCMVGISTQVRRLSPSKPVNSFCSKTFYLVPFTGRYSKVSGGRPNEIKRFYVVVSRETV